MGLLVDLTKITSATAATIGTNTAGTAQAIDFLSGMTMYGAQPGELPADSVSLNYLAQSDDATSPVVRLDPAASVFGGGNTYHRVSIRARLFRQYRDAAGSMPMQALSTSGGAGTFTAGEWVEESSSLLPRGKFVEFTDSTIMQLKDCQGIIQGTTGGTWTLTGKTSGATRTSGAVRPAAQTLIDLNGNTAASNRVRVRIMLSNPNLSAPDLMRMAGSTVAACMYLEDPAGGYAGTELTRNCTESGNVFLNAAGTGLASGVFLPNFPVDEWGWVDFVFDKTTKRFYLFFNRWLMAVHSFANVAANTTTTWTITMPHFPGFRWHFLEMQSRSEASATADTEINVPEVSEDAVRTWHIPPTFANLGVSPGSKLSIGTPTNATWLSRPMSLASGTRPFAEFGEWTTTSNIGVACPFGLSGGLPYVENADGWATFLFAIRPEGNSWSGFFGFQAASFTLDYSGGVYRVRDFAGGVVGTFALNEQPILMVSFNKTAGVVKATLYNNSKDITATIASGQDVTLHGSDVIPLSDNFQWAGSFTSTTSGVKMTIEMISMWKEPMLLSTDSYTNAPLQGTLDQSNPAGGIGQVGTYATAARATIANTSLLSASYNNADCNSHGMCCFPYGSGTPKWMFIGIGRTGRKFTDLVTYQVPGLNYLMGYHHVVFGGLANDVAGATTAPLAASIALALANAHETACLHALARGGKYTWIRTPFPPDINAGTGATMPTFGFALTNSKLCWYEADRQIKQKLETIQASHARGRFVAILDVGQQSFFDGVHLGILGSAPAIADAVNQYKAVEQIADAHTAYGGSVGSGAFAAGFVAGATVGSGS